jgi:hypothetical protein
MNGVVGLMFTKGQSLACIIVKGKKEIPKFGTMTDDLMEMIGWASIKAVVFPLNKKFFDRYPKK